MAAVRCARLEPTSCQAANAVVAHQTGDASPANRSAFSTKRGVHPRRAITATMLGLETPDIAEQMTVGDEPGAVRAVPPCIVAAGRDLKHAAHEPDRPPAGVIADEREPHLGASAKMPMAFFRTSRSMRVRSRSRFSRAISAAWSAGDGSCGAPAATARERAAPVWMAARQFRSIDGEMPTSVATCIKGRPLLSSSATASRLNSGANSRLVWSSKHLSCSTERIKGVHRCEGPSAAELALEAGAPTKTHILNLLHRLVDGKPTDTPTIKAPQALTLTTEPQSNVERYDALRKVREARHAS